jgi:outer membrane protein TolC
LTISEKSEFTKPIMATVDYGLENKRPELLLLASQSKALESQRDIIVSSNLPKVGLFVQGGYGKPGLNMLSNEISPYYIGGLRFSWNLSGFYSQKNNLEKITLSQKSVDVQKETFLFNNNLQNRQQINEIEKLKSSLKNDDEIILLRTNIKKATSAKLENGTATLTDMLREVNAENLARQARALHEIQLYMAVYQLKNNKNN